MFASPTLTSRHEPTTSISKTHATFSPSQSPPRDRSPDGGRPKVVRKKSGEVVKSALKLAAGASLLNCDETASKNVHFNSKLVRVRSFDKLQCPQSVSGVIPMSIRCLNYTSNDHLIDTAPVCLENIELDCERSTVVGMIRVRNFAFQKKVLVRFSYDHWATFDHITATHHKSITYFHNALSQDQFKFKLELPSNMRTSDNPEQRYTIKFAVQYLVNGREHWDNNQGRNYALELTPNIEIDPETLDDQTLPSQAIPIPVASQPQHFITNSRSASPDLIDSFESSLRASNPSRSQLGNRYSFTNSLARPLSPSSGGRYGRSVRLESGFPKALSLSQPIYDTTLAPQHSNNNLSCSPVGGVSFQSHNTYGWNKAKSTTSWFDTITWDEFSNHSPPVRT